MNCLNGGLNFHRASFLRFATFLNATGILKVIGRRVSCHILAFPAPSLPNCAIITQA
jgi:hypothetical protein